MRAASKFVMGGAVVLAMAAFAACSTEGGEEVDRTLSTDSPLIGGDAVSPFNTGAIQIWTQQKTKQGCTAVIFSGHEVLTAAHCVNTRAPLPTGGKNVEWATLKPDYQAGARIAFTNSQTVTPTSRYFETTIVNTDIAPDYVTACTNGCPSGTTLKAPFPVNLAIITITDPFPQSFGLAPPIVSAEPFDGMSETGYGCTQSASVKDTTVSFNAATTILLDPTGTVPPGWVVSDPGGFAQNYYLTLGISAGGPASGCPGDSGGPLFKGGMAPYTALAGINSSIGLIDSEGIAGVNLYTRLDSPAAQSFILATVGKYATPNVLTDRGASINDGSDPIGSLFPDETVSLETPGSPGCTGVILTHDSILTSAHCKVGPTTIAHFYVSDPAGGGSRIPFFQIGASLSVDVATQGVACDPADVANYPSNCFTSGGSTGALHDADLAVLTLASDVPIVFNPVVLGQRGYVWQSAPPPLPTAWEVAAGGTMPIVDLSPMVWSPIVSVSDPSGVAASRGWFYISSPFAFWNDMGGPVYQTPAFLDGGAEIDGGLFQDMTLLGIVSEIGNCADGVVSCSHKNTVVSVTFPDNYDWLVSLGGSPVSTVATFGAGP